jgi:hypothetical protein
MDVGYLLRLPDWATPARPVSLILTFASMSETTILLMKADPSRPIVETDQP